MVVVSLMVELSGSWLYQQHPPLESSVFTNCMIAPVEHRQHESLPASMNPCRVSATFGLNGFGFSGLNDTSLTIEGNGSLQKSAPHFQAPLTDNQCHGGHGFHFPARAGDKLSTCELPYAQQKKFLIFDQSNNETRLIFSSLSPRMENLATPLATSCPAWSLRDDSFGAYHHYHAEKQEKVMEQAWTKTPALCEESGENEIIDEFSEMREDTEEINALLYSEDDDDDGLDDEDDDEVSSGHSPLPKEIRYCEKHVDEKENDDEVASLERSSKRQKAVHSVHDKLWQSPTDEEINDGDYIEALEEGVCPAIGSKRPRKDKIHDTLRVLESIIPGLKSKDPLVVLDEAISYLKCLRCNAKNMSLEDRDGSSCYEH